jgi:hypothetical protein
MEYTCDVIESMPEEVYRQLSAAYPEWGIDRIADYYMENRDSLHTAMQEEAEYPRELEEYSHDQNN